MIKTAAMPGMNGTIRLFQIAGIHVFLHWSWFLVAAYEVQRRERYSSLTWSILEYLALFAIVTTHEFGHALACRQVGGRAERIVLWPLGGVAYVDAPPRPGATLWSIAAGPLVNVALIPVFGIPLLFLPTGATPPSDFRVFLGELNLMNLVLLIFNILPIYPLDGGKIMRSLLWYILGRARSLKVTVIVGFVGVAGIALLALFAQSPFTAILAVFAGMQCASGYKQANALKRLAEMPVREGAECPSCKANPPVGRLWMCGSCRIAIDTFEVRAICPSCNTRFPETMCPNCGVASPYSDWLLETNAPASTVLPSTTPIKAPSVIPVVFGFIACVGAVVFLLVALLLLKVWSDGRSRQTEYQAELDKLWSSEGVAIPGDQTVSLKGGQIYDAYVEGKGLSTRSAASGFSIAVKNAGPGDAVLVRSPIGNPLRREGRTLLPVATFRVSESGQYTVHASSNEAINEYSRFKIGSTPGVLNGSTVAFTFGVAVAGLLAALVLLGMAALLFYFYWRRRRSFNLALRQLQVAIPDPDPSGVR